MSKAAKGKHTEPLSEEHKKAAQTNGAAISIYNHLYGIALYSNAGSSNLASSIPALL